MPRITKIQNERKYPYRAAIYVDQQFHMQIDPEVVYSFGLREGQEICEEKLKEIAARDAYLRGKEQALRFLRFRARTEKEVREKLKKSGFDEGVTQQIIEFLKEYGFVNDEQFARQMIESQRQKYGKNRIIQELSRKGISEEFIQKGIAELDDEEEYEKALRLAQKKKEEIRDADPRKAYGKVGRYLIQKGYDYELTVKVLNKVFRFS